MKKTKLLFSALIATFFFAACSNEENGSEDTNRIAKKGEQNELATLQNTAFQKLQQKFTFNADQERVEITTKNGVRIRITPSRLRKNGQPVHGNVDVEYVEIFRRGDMLTANKTTIGILGASGSGFSSSSNSDQQFRALETGGEFFVNMKQQGQNLDAGSEFQLAVPTQLTGEPDNEMIAWKGEETPDGDVNWVKDVDTDGTDKEVPVNGSDYIMDLRDFGWCNIDKILQFGTGTTLLKVAPPAGYDFSNSKVYLTYSGVRNSMSKLDMYDWPNSLFYEHGNLAPTGLALHILFVSGAGGSWVYADIPVTLTPGNPPVVVSPGDLNTITSPALISYVNGLP